MIAAREARIVYLAAQREADIAAAEAAAAAATSAAKTAKDAAAFAVAAAAHPPVRVISSNYTGLAHEDDAVDGAVEAASDRARDATAFVAAVATANNDAREDDGEGADASPFAVPIDSLVANVLLQSQHAPRTTANPIVPTREYASKSGVRCLRCMHVYHDKSNFNRHCSIRDDCCPPSFRFIHKTSQAIEAAAVSAAAFNASEAPQYSPLNPN
jgi:hypothetical protein